MPTEMQDDKKGGEDRVKKLKEEQQKKMEKDDLKSPGKYPKAPGDTNKDVPRGT